jgi:voltage-gated sodium channel
MENKCGTFYAGEYINVISQIIFTLEIIVKMCADCDKPMRFFNDKFNGGWNRLDFFVIFMGWLEMSPAGIVLKIFPVVVLRLLRLLRVFRLAKALLRLRSIVEALLSGLSAVGWICALVLIYNYIIACFGVLLFKKTDPFHFGTVGRAMFTILRIETLDSWDQILYITMFGCENYPGLYGFLKDNPVTQCKHSYAWGWFGAYIVLFIVLTGSYICCTHWYHLHQV